LRSRGSFFLCEEIKDEKVIFGFDCIDDDGISAGDQCICGTSHPAHTNAGDGSTQGL
jgi:hypothetical protein